MKPLLILAVLGFALSTAAFAQIALTVNEPVNGSTSGSPVTVSATASAPGGISKWDVYVDNVRVLEQINTTTPAILDTTFAATAGSHNVVVKAWNHNDQDTYDTETITVNASALPTPPTGATYFLNLQNNTGPGTPWNIDANSTGSTGEGSYSMTFKNASPSLSGASMLMQNITTSTTYNVLATRKVGCSTLPGGVCTGITHFETDFWVYFAAGNTQSAYEFDPDLYGQDVDFFMSMQFRTHGSAQDGLYLYSKLAPGWQPSDNTPMFPLPSVAAGVWHHIQTYGTMDRTKTSTYPNGSYTYEDFIYDGVPVFMNLGQTYGAGSDDSSGNLEVEQQIDDSLTAGTTTEYLDNYNLCVW